MHIRKMSKLSKVLFLFSHHDDEFGVFFLIEDFIFQGLEVHIVYLTSSHIDGLPCSRREKESIKVLKSLGVYEKNIHYIGKNNKVKDLKLHLYMDLLFKEMLKLFKNNKIEKIIVHCWEGGHPDHDTSHILGVYLAKKLNILKDLYQFPLYSGRGLIWSFFRLFDTFPLNGTVYEYKIPLIKRIRYLGLVLHFKSQIKTFIGLYPVYLYHMLIYGKQYVQNVSATNLSSRPHKGPLLYERRKMGNYDFIREKYCEFINKF
ncbi:PIG-L family deacetylase [Alphaproteobacteria bacterium]|nr:PIG-L family deacetylase [Alphaproteobacteria bacterium]